MGDFWEDSAAAFAAIMATELGDSTFMIAAIMAASESHLAVFLGNMLAMLVMTGIAVLLGKSAFSLLDEQWMLLLGFLCFASFALGCFYAANRCKKDDASSSDDDLQETLIRTQNTSFARTLWKALAATMVAEWGDRSQLSTVTLAGQRESYAVVAGTLAGLTVMTALSVICGGWLASCLEKKSVLVCSGLLFLAFAVESLFNLKANLLSHA
jgi:putative Ca2+/H+ antiporter (TMEM165/GDT1 family)